MTVTDAMLWWCFNAKSWRRTCSTDNVGVLPTSALLAAVRTRALGRRGRRRPRLHVASPYGVRVCKLLMADLGLQQWALKADQRGLLRVVVAGGGVLVRRVLGGALDSHVRHFSYVHTIVCPSKTIVTRRRR